MNLLEGFVSGFDFKDLGRAIGLHGIKGVKEHAEDGLGLHGLGKFGKASGTNALGVALVMGGQAALGAMGGGSAAAADGAAGTTGESLLSSGGSSTGGVSSSSGISSADLVKFQDAMKPLKQGGSQNDGPQYRAEIYQQDPYLQSLMTSTKDAKTKAADGVQEAIDRGMKQQNPIDANGVQVAQIKKLTKQVMDLSRLVTQIERARAGKV